MSGAPTNTDPSLSKKGATRLGSTIKKFWRLKGYDVTIELSKLQTRDDPDGGEEGAIWCLHSDMVDGLPREMARALGLQKWLIKQASGQDTATTH